MLVIVQQAGPGSRLAFSTQGARALWTQTDYLLADVIDLLAEANWQRAGNKHARRPKRVKRPGVDAPDGERKFGRDPIPISEFNDWWFSDEGGES